MVKLNFLYDEIIGSINNGEELFVKPNLSDYNFYSFWNDYNITKQLFVDTFNINLPYVEETQNLNVVNFLRNNFNHQNVKYILDNTYNNIEIVLYENINHYDKYIYPIFFYTSDFHLKYDDIIIPDRILNLVHSGRCKILFMQHMEGNFGMDLSIYEWFHKLSKKYKFNSTNLLIVTSNLMAKDKHEELIDMGMFDKNYTIYPFSYFTNHIYFSEIGPHKLNDEVQNFLRLEFDESLNRNKTIKKDYHFLSFNRSSRLHRIVICTELLCDSRFKDKFILSLMPTTNEKKFPIDFYRIVFSSLNDDYKFSKKKLLNFLRNFDSTIGIKYDTEELYSFNLTRSINREAQRKTFVNIVNETLYEDNTIYITEKTVKPISCAQPFIILGNKGSLKKLKEMGYMTFDRWWDESYDDGENIDCRIEKVVQVIREISTWDSDKCFEVTQEMEETLIHNFNLLMSNNEINELFNVLAI
jgi:hypothetical protein